MEGLVVPRCQVGLPLLISWDGSPEENLVGITLMPVGCTFCIPAQPVEPPGGNWSGYQMSSCCDVAECCLRASPGTRQLVWLGPRCQARCLVKCGTCSEFHVSCGWFLRLAGACQFLPGCGFRNSIYVISLRCT